MAIKSSLRLSNTESMHNTNTNRSWTRYRYITDQKNPKEGYSVPVNRGREAMVYLTYIIDNYGNLPDYAVFVHGHNKSWHQLEPLQFKIRALNLTALDEEGYINLRCEDMAGCELRPFIDTTVGNWDGEKHLREFWDWMLPDVELPRYLSYKCCGQFAVSKKAIQGRRLDQWIKVREPLLLSDEEVGQYAWGKGTQDVQFEWLVGTYYEKFWHVLFGTEGEHCPSVAECRQRYFSNAIACDGDMDTTTWANREDEWRENRCVTAYDNAAPDAEVDLPLFHKMLVGTYGQLQLDRLDLWRKRVKAVEKAMDLEAEVKNLTEQVKSLGGTVREKNKGKKSKDDKKDARIEPVLLAT